MKAIAPGKLILSGEHAAVYGKPALAMAIDRSAVAEIAPAADGQISFDLADIAATDSFTERALRDFRQRIQRNYREFLDGRMGIRDVLRKPIDLFEYAFIMVLDGMHLKLDQGLGVRLRSTIPIGCGLGSSAASILSMLRATGHYFRVDFRPDWYYRYSLEAENLQHGHASGVDSHISLYGGCARFQDGQADRVPLPRKPLHLVDTGRPVTSTGEAVEQVRRNWANDAIWSDFQGVTDTMTGAVRENRMEDVAASIRENHRLLSRIGVVPQRVQKFISEIESRGGAAKVCGAGAVAGDAAGVVWVQSDAPVADLLKVYGYSSFSVRGEPLGVRVV
ncbi:MAG: mevalonate kinase [Kiritimatiellia bacterium]|nr:mevalonate kinase [Kiritimatiellia bacterium]